MRICSFIHIIRFFGVGNAGLDARLDAIRGIPVLTKIPAGSLFVQGQAMIIEMRTSIFWTIITDIP